MVVISGQFNYCSSDWEATARPFRRSLNLFEKADLQRRTEIDRTKSARNGTRRLLQKGWTLSTCEIGRFGAHPIVASSGVTHGRLFESLVVV